MIYTLKYEDRDILSDIAKEYSENFGGGLKTNPEECLKVLEESDIIFVDINEGSVDAVAVYRPCVYGLDPSALAAHDLYIYKSPRSKVDILKESEERLKEYGYEVLMTSANCDRYEQKIRLYRMKGYKLCDMTFVKELK
jgi:hypothetical protein